MAATTTWPPRTSPTPAGISRRADMDLSAEMRRQALRQGVADAIAGITRLQIEDDVYDADYWRDYRAGLSEWQAAGQRPELAEDRKPQAPRADQVAPGSAPCDPGLAAPGVPPPPRAPLRPPGEHQ